LINQEHRQHGQTDRADSLGQGNGVKRRAAPALAVAAGIAAGRQSPVWLA
jgi:hypothetical protein